ncbi:MAG: hypothetical protein KDD78_17950, partial [Caldilineaceae bacterium]|nr:hypothetical protein [Caldilineaceae bacterium]
TMLFLPSGQAFAHQPYCEFADTTAAAAWQVPDSAISYAYYGNLYPAGDIDYFTFDAAAGDSVLLSLSIPAIDGQEDFAPVMAVYGPGLESDEAAQLPEAAITPDGTEAMMVPIGDAPEYWFEPFGGRYYWNWDNYFLDIPEDGAYTVLLWHPEDALGRYSFVVGEDEIIGGDPDCLASFRDYWTPLVAGENPYQDGIAAADADAADAESGAHQHADGAMHDHGEALEMSGDYAPVVDLQVVPLDDGTYNVRIQTMNFVFAPHHVGMTPMDGEGHAHLYIDDVKIARVYGEWYHLDSLPDDAEMISVALYANNHQPLVVEGKAVRDMVNIAELVMAE